MNTYESFKVPEVFSKVTGPVVPVVLTSTPRPNSNREISAPSSYSSYIPP